MDKKSSELLGRPLRAFGASAVAAPLVYGMSELLQRVLPRNSPIEAIDLISFLIGLGCLLIQLVAFVLPCAALVLLALTTAHRWCSHLAVVPIAALVLAGAMFSLGRWLCGIYGLDPPYVPFFLGTALQLVAVATPLSAFGWVVVRVVRADERA